jgi:hypothetical protein
MTAASWIGLMGSALLLGTAATVVARARRYPAFVRVCFFLVPFAAAFYPLGGLPIAGYLRGVIGDLSVTSWTILIATAVSAIGNKETYRTESLSALMLLILGSGFLLYPSALGLTYVDTYAFGYGSKILLTAFFVLSLLTWHVEYHLVAICITASVLAYSLQFLESRNLWDYWIDPLVTFYALFRLSKLARQRPWRVKRGQAKVRA